MLRGKCIIAAVAALYPVISGSSATAAVLYDSQGFETPPFLNNLSLTGQDPVNGPWVTDGATSTATVQSGVAASGSQSVQVTRASSSSADQRWWVEQSITPTERYVIIEWDQRTLQTSQTNVNFGPLFGIEAYDAVGPNIRLAGAALVDSTTGDVLYQESGTGFLTETGSFVPFDQWQHFALQLDYNTDTYQVFLNGAQIATEGFVDSGIGGFSDADIAAVAGSGDPGDLLGTGTAYFDNYIVRTSNDAVPEPASLGVLVIAAAGLLRRGRMAN